MPTPAEQGQNAAVGVCLCLSGLDHRFGQWTSMRFGQVDIAHGFIDALVPHPKLEPPGVHPEQGGMRPECLTDPAERFMAGWIARVHTNQPRLYRAFDVKRVERRIEGKVERLIYEVAHYAGKSATATYVVITWNIDEISMRWQNFRRRGDAMECYRSLS